MTTATLPSLRELAPIEVEILGAAYSAADLMRAGPLVRDLVREFGSRVVDAVERLGADGLIQLHPTLIDAAPWGRRINITQEGRIAYRRAVIHGGAR